MIKAFVLAAALMAAPVLAQAHEVKAGDLTLIHPNMRASMGQSPTTAGYLSIRNDGKVADRLTSASCTCAASVMVHTMKMTGSMASMKAVPVVELPAGTTVDFAPGGMHLMVMGLKGPIKAGDMVDMILTFERAGKVKAPFKAFDKPVATSAAPAMSGDMPGMDHHQH